MKKFWAWSKANPFLAILSVAGIATGITLLVRAIINANKKNGDNAPSEPNSNPAPTQRTQWAVNFGNPAPSVIGGVVGGVRGVSMGSVSAGMSGARVSSVKS